MPKINNDVTTIQQWLNQGGVLSTLLEGYSKDKSIKQLIDEINDLDKNKVDKEVGKGLSANDFTDKYQDMLDNVDTGGSVLDSPNLITSGAVENSILKAMKRVSVTVDEELSETSTNPVQNKAVSIGIKTLENDISLNYVQQDYIEVDLPNAEVIGYKANRGLYPCTFVDTKAREMLDNMNRAGVDKTVSGNYVTTDDIIIGSLIEVETEAQKMSYCGNNLISNNIDDVVKTISFAGKNQPIYSGSPKCIIVRCKPNATYSVKKFENLGGVFRVISTAEKPEVGVMPLTYATADTEIQVTTPNNANWLAIMVANSAYKDPIENVLNITTCVESAEMPTEHEPFVGGTIDVVDGKCEIIANGTTNIFTENIDDILNVKYKIPIIDSINTLNEKMAEIENQEYWKKQRMRFADEPVLVAYSDGGQLGYINTLSAYLAAGIAGYKWLKGDVQPTSDGKLIMCHDDGFTFDANGYITKFDANNCTMIHALTYNEAMSKVYAAWYGGYRMKVCDIEDYLKVCRDFNMRPYITIRKDYMDIVVPELLSMLEKYNFTDHCIVNSFEKESLRLVAEKSNHRVMISNVKFYNEGQQITVEHIQQILDISPNCTICPYTTASGYGTLLFENSTEALAFAKEQNVMLGTCAIGISPTAYYKYGINLFQCYNTWIDTKVTTIPLYVKLTNGVATLESNGVYGDKYTATIEQKDNEILLKNIIRKNSERSYPDGILPHLRDRIPWSCNASSDIVKSCEYSDDYAIVITLNDGATDGDIYVKFVYGLETSSEDTEVREELENKANVIIGISSGENISIKDSADARFRGLNLYGKSKQNKYSGKNLFRILETPQTGMGVTLSYDKTDNTFVLNGTSTNPISFEVVPNGGNYGEVKANDYYTLSFDVVSGSASEAANIYIGDSVNGGTYFALSTSYSAKKITNKYNSDCYIKRFAINVSAADITYTNYKFRIQFEKGQTNTSFEPYVGGKASPSPEYPQEIINSNEINLNVVNKNLIPYPYRSTTKELYGVSCTDNGDGSVTLNGTYTHTTYSDFYLVQNLNIPAGTYTLSGCPSGGGVETYRIMLTIIQPDGTPLYRSDVGNSYTFNADEGTIISAFIRIGTQLGKVSNLTFKPMLELSSTATEYLLHSKQILTISDDYNGIPVSANGNYTDANGQPWICDEIDFTNSMLIKRIYTYIFNGKEDFTPNTAMRTHQFYLKGLPSGNVNIQNCLSTYFIGDNKGSYQGTVKDTIGVRGSNLWVYTSNMETVEEFKAFLKEKYDLGNPLVIKYVLTTPVNIPLTEGEIKAYKALQTYKPVTNIYTLEGAGIEVDYVADTKAYIDNKFIELQQTIISMGGNV